MERPLQRGILFAAESWHWREKLPEAVQELRRTDEDEVQRFAVALEAMGKVDDFTLAYIACALW